MSNRIPLGFFAFFRGEDEVVSRVCITVPCLLGTRGRCYFLDLLDAFQFIFMEVGETRYIIKLGVVGYSGMEKGFICCLKFCFFFNFF